MPLPTQISESVRRLNPQLFGTTEQIQGMIAATVADLEKAKKRIRQSEKPVMNALETRYHGKLIADYPGEIILCQAVRIELARGIWFKPDFFLPLKNLFIEVKGPHAFRGGFENLKVAARVHAGWATFRLVWETDAGWGSQAILP